jgi:ElaB/YqjD/DUF883 family membrane-anchored ribosome-binding protein
MSTTEVTADKAGASATDGAKEKVQGAALQVQEKAEEAKGQLAERARMELDTRSTSAGTGLLSVAQAFQRSADQLREEGQDTPARAVDQVVDRVERLGGYLTQADGARMLQDVESFARRQPWVVVGGSVVVGLLSSRLLKASSLRRYEQQSAEGSGYYGNDSVAAAGSVPPTQTPRAGEPGGY